MFQRIAVGLSVAVLLGGCAGGSRGELATKRLGRGGGEVKHAQGALLKVPARVLATEVDFTIEAAPLGTPMPNGIVVGRSFIFGPEGSTFSSPLTVVLPIDASLIPAGRGLSDVVVMTAQSPGDAYSVLPTRVTDAGHVEADTSHFSIFVPVVLPAAQGQDAGLDGGADGGLDAGADGGACVNACSGGNDAGVDCACSSTCGATRYEIICSGSGPFGCACVENGRQTKLVTLTVCPGPDTLAQVCNGGGADGGADGGFDGGVDGGTDGGRPDGGPDDGGSSDAGTPDGGPDDGGSSDAGTPDGGPDDGGAADAGTPDAGPADGGSGDSGTSDGGVSDGGVADAGSPDAGPADGGR